MEMGVVGVVHGLQDGKPFDFDYQPILVLLKYALLRLNGAQSHLNGGESV